MDKSANQSLLQETIEPGLFSGIDQKSKTEQYKIYKTIFFKALGGMKRGSLRLILPDGSQALLGDPNSKYEPKFHSGLMHIKILYF